MTTPAWGVKATNYDARYAGAARDFGQADFTLPWIHLVPPGARVLDLGCASGWAARQLVERGCSVVGVELDPEAAVRASAWCEEVVVCDLDELDLGAQFSGNSFDAITAADVLEHLRDPVRLLRSAHEILSSSGQLIASIPNVAHGSVRLALLTGTFPYEDAGILDRTHLRFFTLSSMLEMLNASGFTVSGLERVMRPVNAGVPYDRELLPNGMEQLVTEMSEATTFQFLVTASIDRPIDRSSPDTMSPETRSQTALSLMGSQALRDLDRTALELREQILWLENRLADVTASRVWQVWQKFRSAGPVAKAFSLFHRGMKRLSSNKPR